MSSLKFILKKRDETINYLIEEIKHDNLMSKKHKKTCKHLRCVKHLLILVSTNTSCVSISAFTSLIAIV